MDKPLFSKEITVGMYFSKLKNIFFDSTSGIFVGIAMTFSGVGIGLNTDNMQNILTLTLIICIYGSLGLLSAYCTEKFGVKKQKE